MPAEEHSLAKIDDIMSRRAREYLQKLDERPLFDGAHEKIDSREAAIRYALKQLRQNAQELRTELDPDFQHAIQESVIAFASQEGDDMLSIEHEHLVMDVEEDVPLWPLYLSGEEKIEYTHLFLDPRGRLFGLGSQRLIDTMRDFGPHIPIEIPMASIEPLDALTAEQASHELVDTLRIIKKLPKS